MRMRQIRTTVILLVLIAGVIFCAFYFEKHPFLENAGRPTPTPEPQPSPTFRAFNPIRTVEVSPTATPSPTRDPDEETAQTEMADVVTRVYTAEEGIILTFNYSPENGELPYVLKALETINAPAVFFVKGEDLAQFADDIISIIRAGHEIGILMEKDSRLQADRLLEMVEENEKLLRSYGYTDEVFVRTAYGTPTDTHRIVASRGGYRLISFLADLMPANVSRLTEPDQIMSVVFNTDNNVALQRGEIVSFQMGLFQYSNTVLADYIQEIVAKKSVYPVKRLSSMLDNKELQYTYPLKDEQILPEVLNAVHPGHLVGKDVMSELEKRYLGTDWVDRPSFLPGFTREEIIRLDRRGLVQNNEGYVFLTFDDWGPDETLTKLLKVLEKHGAKATFFVRTNNIGYNPNLLRAIAMAGHTIASHTDSHFPLSHDTGNGRVFETLTDEEALDLQKDLVLSYEKLQRVVGDIEIDGKPALSLLFRPPTLAVSKIGLQTVIDCGFHYSVSGSFSTEDYKATNEQSLYWSLLRNTKSGAVLVMHMSQNSIYTADAVDKLLTEMERRKSPLKFVSLSECLH